MLSAYNSVYYIVDTQWISTECWMYSPVDIYYIHLYRRECSGKDDTQTIIFDKKPFIFCPLLEGNFQVCHINKALSFSNKYGELEVRNTNKWFNKTDSLRIHKLS